MCTAEVLNGVSFSLCALNSLCVCQNLDPASSSSPSWCCDDADGTPTDACSPPCPSLELWAWWMQIESPNQICHIQTDFKHHYCNFPMTFAQKEHGYSHPYTPYDLCKHEMRNITGVNQSLSWSFTIMQTLAAGTLTLTITLVQHSCIWHLFAVCVGTGS